MKSIIFALVILLANVSLAQLTGQYPFKTYVDNSGNIYVTGYEKINGDKDIWLREYNSSGNIVVDKTYPNAGDDMGLDIRPGDGGSVIITGYLYNSTTACNDIVVLAYHPNTIAMSCQTYSSILDGKGYSLAVDANDDIYICGYYSSSRSGKDFIILKYNSFLSYQWAAKYNAGGNSGDDVATKILLDAGYVYVVGYEYNASTSSKNIAMATFDKNDGSLSQRLDPASGSEDKEPTDFVLINPSIDVAVKSKGAFTGFTTFMGSANGVQQNYLTALFNVIGDSNYIAWVDTFGTAGQNIATGIVSDANEDVIVTGYVQNRATGNDFGTVKYAGGDGTQQWVQYYDNANGNDQASGITIDAAGHIIVSGYSQNTQNQYIIVNYRDAYPNVQKMWSAIFTPQFLTTSFPVASYNYATYAGRDNSDNIYVLAFDWNKAGNNNYSAVKYDSSGNLIFISNDSLGNHAGKPHGSINSNTAFKLDPNYPNPFNPSTNISYTLPVGSFVTLKVYDLLGREINTLVKGNQDAGSYKVNFDGSALSSGIYIYKLTALAGTTRFEKVEKMTLIK